MCCLYTSERVSLFWPNVVPANVLRALSLGLHFVTMLFMLGAKDMEVLYVTPNILVSCVCGMVVLFSVVVGLCWCSLLWLVRRALVDLVGATLSLFCDSQFSSCVM